MTHHTQVLWKGAGDGQQFFIEIDAVTREGHSYDNDVTDHPVETGSNISDHVRAKPITITLDGVISNAPQFLPKDHVSRLGSTATQIVHTANMRGYDNRQSIEATSGRTVQDISPISVPFGLGRLISVGAPQSALAGREVPNGSMSITALGFTAEFDRVQDVFDEFVSLQQLGTILQVQTSLRMYENMVIQGFSANRQTGDGECLKFTLELKQIRTVTTKDEPLPVVATKRKDKGSQAGKETPTTADVDKRSMFFQMVGDDLEQIQ